MSAQEHAAVARQRIQAVKNDDRTDPTLRQCMFWISSRKSLLMGTYRLLSMVNVFSPCPPHSVSDNELSFLDTPDRHMRSYTIRIRPRHVTIAWRGQELDRLYDITNCAEDRWALLDFLLTWWQRNAELQEERRGRIPKCVRERWANQRSETKREGSDHNKRAGSDSKGEGSDDKRAALNDGRECLGIRREGSFALQLLNRKRGKRIAERVFEPLKPSPLGITSESADTDLMP